MSFSLPDGLAPELYPLSWLIGTWHGFGMIAYENITERSVVNEITIETDGGPYLKVTTTFWNADPELSGPIHPEMTGAEGYAALVKDVQWSTETSYWRPVDTQARESGPAVVQLEIVTSDPDGHATLWVGEADGPRITVASDALISSPTAQNISSATRVYGLVQSDLLWAWDMAAFDQPLGTYAWARLGRTEQPTAN